MAIIVSLAGTQELDQTAKQQYEVGDYERLVRTTTQAIENVGLYTYLIEEPTYYTLAVAAEPITEEHMEQKHDASPMKATVVVYKALGYELLYELTAAPKPRLSYDVYRYTDSGDIVLLDKAHSIATMLAITALCFN